MDNFDFLQERAIALVYSIGRTEEKVLRELVGELEDYSKRKEKETKDVTEDRKLHETWCRYAGLDYVYSAIEDVRNDTVNNSNAPYIIDAVFEEGDLIQPVNVITDKDVQRAFGEILQGSSPQSKCECGSEKCGFGNHSEWCPKFGV
jgi:hypothetical protein